MARTQHTQASSLVRWGAIVAGAVVGVALIALIMSFFVALGSEVETIANNLHWYGLIAAIVALFVAGLLAGGLSREPGVGSGLLHGVTAWGLILVALLAFPFPQAFGVLEGFTQPIAELTGGPLWAAFMSLLAGVVVAAVGGLIGGMITGRRVTEEDQAAGEYEAGREFEAGRAYEAERLYEASLGHNGGQPHEEARETRRQPVAAGQGESRGRRRR